MVTHEDAFIDELTQRLREAIKDPVGDWPLSWIKIVRARADIVAILDVVDVLRSELRERGIKSNL